jgi:hypothetical protein
MNRHRELEYARRLREKRERSDRLKGVQKPPRLRGRYLSIVAPETLDFDQNYEPTIRFLEQIRRTSAAGGHTMLVWMRRCNALSPEVALVLAAEIERCLHHRPGSINGNDPRSGAIAAMLRDIGFHKLLHFNEPRVSVPHTNEATTYLKMKSGVQGAGQHADDLRSLVLGNAASTSDELREDMVRGLNEAVLNIHQHAYEEGIDNLYVPMPNKRWWIAGYRDAAGKEIGFIAFDQGVGIPATLPQKHAEFVLDLIAAAGQVLRGGAVTNDHLLIARAFELGRSRTGKTSQGKGLTDFKRFLAAAGGKGSLRILSGRGSYLYHYDGREIAEPLSLPFHGTLIIWRLIDSTAVQWESET